MKKTYTALCMLLPLAAMANPAAGSASSDTSATTVSENAMVSGSDSDNPVAGDNGKALKVNLMIADDAAAAQAAKTTLS